MSVPPDRSSHRSRLLTRDCSRTRAACRVSGRIRANSLLPVQELVACGPCVSMATMLSYAPPDPPLRRKPMTPHRHAPATVGLALVAALSLAPAAGAQIAVSANDNKVVSLNGVVTVVPNAPPDTVSVIDLKASPPRVIAEVEAPVSVVGPPLSIAVTPDESLALVTASSKVDPSDPTKQAPDNRLTVIDLTANPLKIIATLEAGKGASGISINRQGSLALVSNLVDGTVSVFTIQGKTVSAAGALHVRRVDGGGGAVVIAPEGKTALVSRRDDNRISVLSIDGSKVEYTKRDMTAGVRPIVLDIASSGAFAMVASLAGSATGDNDRDRKSVV